jgi:hypothetical protein
MGATYRDFLLRFVADNFHLIRVRGFLSATIDGIMEAMRNAWTDERLDDLAGRVDTGFARLETRFDKLETRFDKLQQVLVQIAAGMVVAVLGMFAALVGLIATLH